MTIDTSPLIFLMGTTGQTGRHILDELDRDPGDARIRIGVRKQKDLERLRAGGAMRSCSMSTIRALSAGPSTVSTV